MKLPSKNMNWIQKYLFLCIFLLCPLTHADSLSNGIYSIVKSDDGIAIKTLDDSEVHLGEKFIIPMEKIVFRSISNDNESYFLSLEKAGPFPKDFALLALY